MSISIKWLSVASFEIRYNDHHIVTDPYISINEYSPCTKDSIDGCDIITLSHPHYDHISDIPYLMDQFNPLLLCGEQTALPISKWVNCNPMSVYSMYPNMELDFDWVKIKALYGIHMPLEGKSSEVNKWLSQFETLPGLSGIHELQEIANVEYRNYLFTFPNSFRILIWGNAITPMQTNMFRNLKPDVAILQATGQADDPEVFADFALSIGAKTIIPHHQDINNDESFWMPRMVALQNAISNHSNDQDFIILKHGEWIDLD